MKVIHINTSKEQKEKDEIKEMASALVEKWRRKAKKKREKNKGFRFES